MYKDAAKLELSFTGTPGEQYAVFLLKDSTVPTQGSIKYIDQTEGSNVKFTVYPYDLGETGSYGLYVSSTNMGYTKVAEFSVTDSWEEAPYTLGDVNMDGSIDVIDASLILRYAANLNTLTDTQKAAADVNGNNSIDVIDASMVLRYAANLIDSF